MMYQFVDKMKSSGMGRLSTDRQDIPPGYGGLIEFPDINDVLSGRGGRINNHPGNIYYRKLVSNYKHSYLDKNTKKLDKVKIADHIVVTIRNNMPSGRFLKEDSESKLWKEIGDEKARKKAGQAMREKANETRQELEEGTVTPLAVNSPVNALSPLTSMAPISPDHAHWNNQLPMSAGSIPMSTLSNVASMPSPVISHSGSYEGNIRNPGGAYITPDSVPSGYPQAGAVFGSNNLHIAPRSNYAPYGQSIMPMPFPTQHLSPHRPYSDIGKTNQSTIPEDKPPLSAKEERNGIIGAEGAAFNRPFNPLSDSSSTGVSSHGNMSSMKSSINSKSTTTSISIKSSISNNTMSPTLPLEKPSLGEMSDEDDEETKRNNFHRMGERNSAGASRYSENEPLKNFQDNEFGGRGPGDPDSERSYLPQKLTERGVSNTSLQLSDVRGLSRSMDRSISSPLIGSVKDMSLNSDEFLGCLLNGSSEVNLNGPELTGEDKDWINTSQNTKSSSSNSSDAIRERLKSETSQMSFRFERGTSGGNSSSDAMSVDSRRSSTSGWLNSFKGMNGLPPEGDLRARFFSDCSNRSMFSELSTDMLALDLAANLEDPLNYIKPPSPPTSPPTSP